MILEQGGEVQWWIDEWYLVARVDLPEDLTLDVRETERRAQVQFSRIGRGPLEVFLKASIVVVLLLAEMHVPHAASQGLALVLDGAALVFEEGEEVEIVP